MSTNVPSSIKPVGTSRVADQANAPRLICFGGRDARDHVSCDLLQVLLPRPTLVARGRTFLNYVVSKSCVLANPFPFIG
jgi:hypothetical protein